MEPLAEQVAKDLLEGVVNPTRTKGLESLPDLIK